MIVPNKFLRLEETPLGKIKFIMESLLHNFFGNSCLNIDVFDNNGQRHTPREWFIVPYEVIYQAIHFILNGEITDMRYDPVKQEIVGK